MQSGLVHLDYVAGSPTENRVGALGIIGRVLVAGGCKGDLGGDHRPPCTGPQPEQGWSKEVPPASTGVKKPPEQGQTHRRRWMWYDSRVTAASGEWQSSAIRNNNWKQEEPQQLTSVSCAVPGSLKGTERMEGQERAAEVSGGKLMYSPSVLV